VNKLTLCLLFLSLFSASSAIAAEAKPKPKDEGAKMCIKSTKSFVYTCGNIKFERSITTENDVTLARNLNMPSKEDCDLGLKMPGLPDFNVDLDFSLPSACTALRAVTAGMILQINNRVQNEVDNAIEQVTNGNTQLDFDLQSRITDTLSNAANDLTKPGTGGQPGGNTGRGGYDTGGGNSGGNGESSPPNYGAGAGNPNNGNTGRGGYDNTGGNGESRPPNFGAGAGNPNADSGNHSGGSPVPSHLDYLTGRAKPKPKPPGSLNGKKPPQDKLPQHKPPESKPKPEQVCVYGECN